MDQLPLEFKLTLLLKSYDDLLNLLEKDRDKWQWLITELEMQFEEQVPIL